MSTTFIVSDTHFGHANILNFQRPDGGPLRDFQNITDHDETLIKNWNSVVSPSDRVYHLGDIVINRRYLWLLSRLQGRKCLIKGNHDIFKLKDYTPYFDDIRACVVKKNVAPGGIIFTHIPIHPDSLRWGTNIHGHLHINKIPSPKYINVCVEHTNYTPVAMDDLIKRIKEVS